MNENEEKNLPGAGGAEAQPAPGGEGAAHKRRRRRPGYHRRPKRHIPEAAPGGDVQIGSGTADTAAVAGISAAAKPSAPPADEFIPEGEEAADANYAGETEPAEAASEAASGTAPETGVSSAPGGTGSGKRRRRRRGGRRHRRRGAGQPEAVNQAGSQGLPPLAPGAAAEESRPAAGETPEPRPETAEAQNRETPGERIAAAEPKPAGAMEAYAPPAETRRVPAAAPDSASAEPVETYVDISKLTLRQEADAFKVMKFPGLDAGRAKRLLIQFLQEQREKTGLKKAVLGLSGSLDSSVSAILAAEALGAENILLYFFLDGGSHNDAERERAGQVANRLRRSLEVVDIRPQLEAFFAGQSNVSPQRRRQRAAWEWMAVLYDQAMHSSALVISTSNKTKRLLGSAADFGQNGHTVNLVGDLYQSQVRELARVLNLPNSILDKEISPALGLEDLGFSLQEADGFLYQIVDVRVSLARLLDLGVEEEKLRRIYRRIKESAFRRSLSPVAESLAVYVPRSWGAGAR